MVALQLGAILGGLAISRKGLLFLKSEFLGGSGLVGYSCSKQVHLRIFLKKVML